MSISGVSNSISSSYTLRQVVRPQVQATAPEFQKALSNQAQRPLSERTPSSAKSAPSRPAIPEALNPLIEGVQQTAEQMGYVDVSPTAIYRAYANKQSLLVDVRA